MSVRRWACVPLAWTDDWGMEPEEDGDYVRSEDYDALVAAAGKVVVASRGSYWADNPDLIDAIDDLHALLGEKP